MQLYNSLSRSSQEFSPIKKKQVGMYHCGPTVYNYAHIGNLRAYVFADILRRSFEYNNYDVKQVINITDVGHLTSDQDTGGDKVEEGARREHKTVAEIVDLYTDAFFDDLKKLNIKTAGTRFPKATDHISEQIALIKRLEEKGFTYSTSDGLYFDTSRFPAYGALGNIDLKHLEEGARVGVNKEKKNPTDFALWKRSATPGERMQEWPSPWGVGFPGWHVECSAMAMKYLGETFDIHTGGIDHIPVHHNNEIAQSEASTGKHYVNTWLHSEFVTMPQKDVESKMSKSSGNFIRLETLIEYGIHPLAYRYWLLTAHYRSPILFSYDAVLAAQRALESLIFKISLGKNPNGHDDLVSFQSMQQFFKMFSMRKIFGLPDRSNTKEQRVRDELNTLIENDLNTPGCIALLHKVADQISHGEIDQDIVRDFDRVLGLRLGELVRYTTNVPEKIKKLSKDRETLRVANQWAEADRIRKELEDSGFMVNDTADGPVIRRSIMKFS